MEPKPVKFFQFAERQDPTSWNVADFGTAPPELLPERKPCVRCGKVHMTLEEAVVVCAKRLAEKINDDVAAAIRNP